jgi:peptide deformylase
MEVITVDDNPNVLHKKCDLFTPDSIVVSFQSIINQMKDILLVAYAGHGKGLAAPQVGITERFFILKLGSQVKVFINPEITKYSTHKIIKGEACLSIPDKWFRVTRSRRIEVKYQDENFCWKRATFCDYDAVAFQHEFDHLNGVLISDIGQEIKEVVEQEVVAQEVG